jgi:hypothetical protein
MCALIFECAMAHEIWKMVSPLAGLSEQLNLLALTRWWICDKKHKVPNIIHMAVLWVLWKMRNDLSFNRVVWSGMQVLCQKVGYTCAMEDPVCPVDARDHLGNVIGGLEQMARQPP